MQWSEGNKMRCSAAEVSGEGVKGVEGESLWLTLAVCRLVHLQATPTPANRHLNCPDSFVKCFIYSEYKNYAQ